jgi:hypothetical protein
MSAMCLAIGYAYAAGLAGSWSDIHGARATAVLGGAALGIALASVSISGCRQGVYAWLMVVGVMLIAGFAVTRQQIAPPAGSAGKVSTSFEAAVFALCCVLWCVPAFVFLWALPRMWRARMAFSRHERGLHITRAEHWSEASSAPIPLSEWLQFTQHRDDLTAYFPREPEGGAGPGRRAARRLAVTQRQLLASREWIVSRPDLIARDPDLARFVPPGQVHAFASERGDGSRMYLTWVSGQIVIAGVGKDRAGDIASMQPIAWALGARLVDDDGTVYEQG